MIPVMQTGRERVTAFVAVFMGLYVADFGFPVKARARRTRDAGSGLCFVNRNASLARQ